MFVSRLQKKNLDNIVTFQFITWHTFFCVLYVCILCMAVTNNDVLFVVVTYKFLPRTTSGGKMMRKRNRRKRTVRQTILVRRVMALWRKKAKKMEVRKSERKHMYWRTFVFDLGVLWISQIIV